MRRRPRAVLVASRLVVLVTLLVAPVETSAQITITSPASGARLPAGPDHFTDVVGDPMDFDNAEDFMAESLGTEASDWTGGGPTLSSGRLTGTTTGGDNGVTLVHPGFASGSLNLFPSFGTETPIDTTRFRRLAFRVKSSNASDLPAMYIQRAPIAGPQNPTVYQAAQYGTMEDRIYDIDLTRTPDGGPTWTSSNQAFGLRFDPNEAGSSLTVELDWVRFTVADSHPDAVSTPIAWSGGSTAVTVELLDSEADVVLETIATGQAPASRGSFTWFHGHLAPGPYRIRVRDAEGSSTIPITINDPPVVHITDPDRTGGEDWATAVLGDAWDMSTTSDVVSSSNVVNLSSDGSVLSGRSPDGNGDPTLTLATNAGIDSSYHRLTIRMRVLEPFDLGAGSHARVLFGDVVGDTSAPVMSETQDIITFDGFQEYVIDLSELEFDTGLEPPAYKTWDQMATIRHFRLDPHEFTKQADFEIDDVTLARDDETAGGMFTITWDVTDTDDAPTVTLEYDDDTDAGNGTLGQIAAGLAAVTRGSFTWDTSSITPGLYFIRATVSDGLNSQSRYSSGPLRVLDPSVPASLTLTVTTNGGGVVTSTPTGIACGPDCAHVYVQGTNVTLTPSPNPGSVFAGWTGDVVCQDGVAEMIANRSCTANFATILPSPATPGVTDFNGDRGGDAVLYDPTTGAYRVELDRRAFGTTSGTWSPGWELHGADFDADGIADLLFYDPTTGAWFKGISDGLGGFAFFGGTWSPDWKVTILDLDGDDRSDVFLYNETTGQWFRGTSLGDGRGDFAFIAGTWSPGWNVFAADWNGDDVDDLLVYDETTGHWFRITTIGSTFAVTGGTWSPGWEVHPGDYDGDGRSDVFLYNASTGAWYTGLNDGSGFSFTPGNWSPAWTVRRGDLNADGRADLFLYNVTSGDWFMCFSTGAGGFTFAGGSWSPGWTVRLTDYDGDRRGDVLLYDPSSGAYFQGTNTGPGSFSFQGGNWGPGWTTIVATRTTTP